MTDTKVSGFEERLLPLLLPVVEERARGRSLRGGPSRRRRRWLRRTAGVALGAAAVILGTTFGVGSDSTIRVSAADAVANPQGLQASLREAGIEATILVVPVEHPVSPVWWHLWFPPGAEVDRVTWAKLKAQVGVGVGYRIPQLDEIFDGGRGIDHREVLALPGGLRGPVTLVVGRAARPGEVLAGMDNELAPDGAFWCLGLDRMGLGAARRTLQDLGYQVVLVDETSEVKSNEVDHVPVGAKLTWAYFRAPDVVDVRFTTEQPAKARAAEGTLRPGGVAPSWAPKCHEMRSPR